MPLISIIMPAYNAEKFIKESILSVQNQTYKNWELIVVDDGSTDCTAKIIQQFSAKDKRIKYIFQENSKLGATRNAGLLSAKGEWVAYLDSDDLWMPDKLDSQIKVAQSIGADVIFTGGHILYDDTGEIKDYHTQYGFFNGKQIYKLLFAGNFIPVLSVIMKRPVIDLIGLQDESPYAYGCEDWDYWLRISKTGANLYGIDKKLFHYRIHANGMSQNLINMKMAECYLLFKNLDQSYFNSSELKIIKLRFSTLVRQIVPYLFRKKNDTRIIYFLNIMRCISNQLKYKVAIAAYKLFGFKSSRLVTFLLYH